MGWYYNRTRGPYPVQLQTGSSLCMMPKTWSWIEPKDEGSPALLMALQKNDIVRGKSDAAPIAKPAVEQEKKDSKATEPVQSKVHAPQPVPVEIPLEESGPGHASAGVVEMPVMRKRRSAV